MESDHYKISPTAVLCARARANYTDMPYAKEIYSQLEVDLEQSDRGMIPQWLVSLCLHIPSIKTRASVLEGRYHSTNAAIRKLGANVGVLELAAGLSPRGLEMGEETPYYIESDLEEMIGHKEKITGNVRKLEGKEISKNHYFRTINPIYESDLEQAAQIMQSYSSENPLAIVHEGLFMYLSESERKTARDNIRNFLAKHNPQGAWITPDFSSRPENSGWVMNFLKGRIAKKTERSFNGFTHDDKVSDFLAEGGLNGEFVPNVDVARNLSCIDILGLNPKKVAEYAKNYRAAFITLK